MIEETHNKETEKRKELEETVKDAEEIAEKFKLNPKPVNFWLVDYDEVYKLVANQGFPERYSHWRRGMTYKKFKSQGKLGTSKVYELVINDNPCHAYLQKSNANHIQKAVIAHVIGHSDFFANNEIFKNLAGHMENNAVEKMKSHSEKIDKIIEREDVSRREVEEWIDNVLCIEDNINPYHEIQQELEEIQEEQNELTEAEAKEKLAESLGNPTEDIINEVFSDTNVLDIVETKDEEGYRDLLLYILDNGMKYDEEKEEAVEMEDWEKEIIRLIREESYYFAPQKLTKYMNEGWSNYWESKMLTTENLIDEEEYIQFGQYVSKILSARQGQNPYKMGRQLWEHIEEKENRDEIFEKILSVENITPENIFNKIKIEDIIEEIRVGVEHHKINKENIKKLLEENLEDVDKEIAEKYLNDEITDYQLEEKPWKLYTYSGHSKRHYCFNTPRRVGLLYRTTTSHINNLYQFIENKNKYKSIEEAINDINYARGWDKMRQIRSTSSDVNFVRHFDKEIVEKHGYVQQEYDEEEEEYVDVSDNVQDMKEQLLIQLSDFGKPTIIAEDKNYNNRKELLLSHKYNGIKLDLEKAKETLKRVYRLWGRPVHLQTVKKEQKGNGPLKQNELLLTYDGSEIKEEKGKKIEQEISTNKEYENYDISSVKKYID